MKSGKLGKNISPIEINISGFGVWLLVNDMEYFLSYQDYPWFQKAKVSDVYNVELLHETHLHWPSIDVDLDLQSLDKPENYPLVYQQ